MPMFYILYIDNEIGQNKQLRLYYTSHKPLSGNGSDSTILADESIEIWFRSNRQDVSVFWVNCSGYHTICHGAIHVKSACGR